MTKTVYATFLGGDASGDTVTLRLEEPMELQPNARVMLTDVGSAESSEAPKSFLDVVQGLKLDGPADLSTRLHEYLYGDDGEDR
jgi:hypothetical protein